MVQQQLLQSYTLMEPSAIHLDSWQCEWYATPPVSSATVVVLSKHEDIQSIAYTVMIDGTGSNSSHSM